MLLKKMTSSGYCKLLSKNELLVLAFAYLIVLGYVLVSTLLSLDETTQNFKEYDAHHHYIPDTDPEMRAKYTIAILSIATIILTIPFICFIIGVLKVSKSINKGIVCFLCGFL